MVEFGQFINFESIDSTNRYCVDLLAKSNPKPFTVISADYQSQGTGQIGSKWVSEPGQNVLMSVIVYPEFINAYESFKLHYIASLACVEALTVFLEESRVTIKWPNDILVDRKKIAGILIKNTFQGKSVRHSVIGFGLNLNQTDFSGLSGAAVTSLALAGGKTENLPAFRELLFQKFVEMYRLIEKGISLKELYTMKLFGYDETFRYFDATEGRYRSGMIHDVREDGHIAVETDGGVKLFGFKELKFVIHE